MHPDDDLLVPPAAAPDPHLLDSEFGGEFNEAQAKHLAGCEWCQQRLSQAEAHPDLADEEAFLAAARARAASGEADALAQVTALAPPLHALASGQGSRDDVQVGQMWRLRWRNTTELAVVLDLDRWWATVAPVTSDVDAADDYSVVLPPAATILGVSTAICISLECLVPIFVFDRPVPLPAQSGTDKVEKMPPASMLRDVWRAWRRGHAPPTQLTYGEPPLEGDLGRRELRNTIAAGFNPLVGASALIAAVPKRQAPGSLTEMIGNLGSSLTELAEVTGLQREVFLRIKQGGRVTAEEADRLARLLDTDSDTVLAAVPPLDGELITDISRPLWRNPLRRIAEYRRTTEDEERWRMANAVAASQRRTTKAAGCSETRDKPAGSSWTPVIEMHLRAEVARLAGKDHIDSQRHP